MSRVPHKHAELIKAWADGAEIQVRVSTGGPWQSFKGTEYPLFYDEYFYRVKPTASQSVELFADCGTSERGGNWRVTGVGGYKPNMRLSFDPDSGELLSVEKL